MIAAFSLLMCVGDDQLHAPQPAPGEAARRWRPADIWPITFDRPIEKGLHALADLFAQA